MAKSESLQLNQVQRQQQTLAPMQLQYVRMLEMNSPEVEDEVQRALDENPALEVDDDDSAANTDTADGERFSETAEQMMMADYSSPDDIPFYRTDIANRSASDPYYEPEAVAQGESMMDALTAQLAHDRHISDSDMEIARFIIGNIDPNGYMTRSIQAIADDMAIASGRDVDIEDVRRVWQLVRSLDPAGIAAVDLRDSLLLQLRRLTPNEDVDTATEIIRDYFDVFSLMHYKQLQSLLGIDADRLRSAIGVIRTLNPKPGAMFGNGPDDRTNQITPDFLVEADGDRLHLTLLNNLPRLRISRSFAADTAVSRRQPDADRTNVFIRQRRDDASGFIRALSMRQETLFRVMSAIMQWQRNFFLTDDPARLRPMILKDISEVTGDGISVISRATAGKYVATARGVYPLRFFFSEARGSEGDDASSATVMLRLRELIDAEDKHHPLTDEALTRMLADEGINIARRTVAKYRERMSIPVGRLRKQL